MAGAELTPPSAASASAALAPAVWLPGLSAAPRRTLALLGSLLGLLMAVPAHAAAVEPLMQLLERRACPECQLQDADLVHADLRDADLRRAQLQRANLSGARLDGARLAGADLSFTSLQGASLRGADLRGARLEGTDLRSSDLSGAQLDPAALARSHWQGARGLPSGGLGYAELHNAGVDAFRRGRLNEAEQWFGAALARQPEAAITWVARAITRLEAGSKDFASQDLRYAASLYQAAGEEEVAGQLIAASTDVLVAPPESRGGNGAGSHVLQGAFSALQGLAPLALKVLAGF